MGGRGATLASNRKASLQLPFVWDWEVEAHLQHHQPFRGVHCRTWKLNPLIREKYHFGHGEHRRMTNSCLSADPEWSRRRRSSHSIIRFLGTSSFYSWLPVRPQWKGADCGDCCPNKSDSTAIEIFDIILTLRGRLEKRPETKIDASLGRGSSMCLFRNWELRLGLQQTHKPPIFIYDSALLC